jgi:ferrous iron transport protein B
MLESGWSFVRRAGTLILTVSILVWAAAYYPRNAEDVRPELFARQQQLQSQFGQPTAGNDQPHDPLAVQHAQDELSSVDNEIQGEYLRHSYLGRMGRWIEPVVRPLGWDWRIGCAVFASFPAREVVVATLGVIYNLGTEQDEASTTLRDTLRNATWEGTDRRVFDVPVALSVMVFFALCAQSQCVSTLVVMRRETNSWRWPIFTFVYMTTLAYLAALLVYQIGSRMIA